MMYYGEELGMTTQAPTRKEDVKDPIGITGWPKEKGRDGERTPMQWTPGPQAGFSTNPHTWLPVAPDYKAVNVATESKEPNSQLTWFEKLVMLRRDNPALHAGSETMLDAGNEHVLSWVRSSPDGKSVVVAMNFSAEPQAVTLDASKAGVTGSSARTLATNDSKLEGTHSLKSITLTPFASYVAEIQ
jgi:alpha-glucosidase